MNRNAALAVACSLMSLAVLAGPARAELLPDSTQAESWRLANGLEVRVRNIPGTKGIAIVMAYRAGNAYEPPTREGLVPLLAELEFTGPAGAIPERSREDMDSVRPLGWGLRTGTHLVSMTEIATRGQFPGVLRQVATRAAGVTVTPAGVQSAVATVRKDLATRGFGRADLAMYYRVRDLATGVSDESAVRRAGGKGLDGLTPKEVEARLHALFVPANAALAIAGDLSGVDVHALVEHEFGAIPAGVAQAETPEPRLKPGARTITWDGLAAPTGVVGIFAPALEDSVHPAFFLATLVTGAWFRDKLGAPTAPVTTRFQYSIFDEPDLIRLYPDPDAGNLTPAALTLPLTRGFDQLGETDLTRDLLDRLRFSVDWLLGGPLPPPLLVQARDQSGVLGTLAGSMATRAMWRGDAFWDLYRARFETTLLGHNTFMNWMAAPEHQAALLLVPRH